jgi:predicted PurR-regulated permease PerM
MIVMDKVTRARDVVAATLTVVGVLGGIALLIPLRGALISFFVAVLLSSAVQPIVMRLQGRLGGRFAAAVLVHVGLVAVLVGFALVLLPLVAEQVASLWRSLPGLYSSLREQMASSDSSSLQRLAASLPAALDLSLQEPSPAPVPRALAFVGAWVGAIGAALLVATAILVLSFYWSVDGERTIRSLLLLVPLDRRSDVSDAIQAASETLAAFMRGQLILCVFVGALAFVAYLLIGLPNALALGLVAGLLEVVPMLGPILGAIPAGVVALSIDPSLALWVVVATTVIQVIENYVLVPRVMDRSVGVNPLVTILAITAFGAAMGVVGALLAIPIAALAQLFLNRYLLDPDAGRPPAPSGRDELSALRYEAQHLALDIRQQVRHKEERAGASIDAIEDEIEALAQDLDRLLARESSQDAEAP